MGDEYIPTSDHDNSWPVIIGMLALILFVATGAPRRRDTRRDRY